MNPLELLQLKASYETFQRNHPKFPLFLKAVHSHGLDEGTIIEMSVKMPDGKDLSTNLKLSASDIQLLKEFEKIAQNK